MTEDLGALATERARPDLADLDQWSTRALVDLVTTEDALVVEAVRAEAERIAAVADLAVERLERGGRMVYGGAGTAGRLAVLDATELAPTYGVGDDRVVALLAGGPDAMTRAVEGAEDDTGAARADLAALDLGPDDLVIAISASGRTPYARALLVAAREAGAATVAVANNPGSVMAELADVAITLDTGPEIVAGSTRMKAGTSQKMLLTALSTAVMVRLGKVHRNLMVDVAATNVKLRVRAERIVGEATGAGPREVRTALDDAGGHAKTAIVALLAGVDARTAGRLLSGADGRVSAAVAAGAGGPVDGGPVDGGTVDGGTE
ncbi:MULTISPECIES: N-acetylmuramic acid 6-phosphate etherase [unclassified Pseudonocardia]|uniref:N-acetylmuramic acid 6-phosphate etherase n=1 Tax=unclassified Pseudonocardia TaxID=2619320 RepID=UPI00096170B4|nr:N-acetylmuramic acid 6-phosphate etherase [Pseudonocardia sp. Ae707_Ps1]OLM18746.1 N-acetylmuramic acid 6-phosphate etherase [Pseudonocardia sp. Ae707_Ps1]